MTTTTVVTMAVVCGIVWGGFAVFLRRAVRSESRRDAEDAPPTLPP